MSNYQHYHWRKFISTFGGHEPPSVSCGGQDYGTPHSAVGFPHLLQAKPCWTATPSIPDHWPGWMGLVGLEVQGPSKSHFLYSNRQQGPSIKRCTFGENKDAMDLIRVKTGAKCSKCNKARVFNGDFENLTCLFKQSASLDISQPLQPHNSLGPTAISLSIQLLSSWRKDWQFKG